MTLHELEHGGEFPEREVALGIPLPVELVLPRVLLLGLGDVGVVAALSRRLQPAEQPSAVRRRLESRVDQEGGVGVVGDVVLEAEIVLDRVVDEPVEERDVRSRPQGDVLFFFNDTATTEIYTLSLHDALPI